MSKNAYIHLTEHNSPHIKGMEMGKRYQLEIEVEPVELSTGENEYTEMDTLNGRKGQKPPMHGRFKVHSIHMASAGKTSHRGGKSSVKEAKDSAAEERGESKSKEARERKAGKEGKAKGRYA